MFGEFESGFLVFGFPLLYVGEGGDCIVLCCFD